MTIALTVVSFLLFTIGVFVDGKELVSVTEGDSVTLKSGVTKIQKDDEIKWTRSGLRIAKRSSNSSDIPENKLDGSFKHRLQLDNQTGDLTISNISTTDSGEYKVTVSSPGGSPEMTFNVSVLPADAVSVTVGDSVTLLTGLTDIQRDGVVRWRFGQQKSHLAEILSTSDGPDGRFRDGLQLNHQTGSLNITDTRTTHSGLYEVEINSSRYITHNTFILTVSDDVRPVSVMEGDTVTLHTGLTGSQRVNQILWKFEDRDEVIADLNGTVNNTWSNADLNTQTRDLYIRNIRRDQHGDYKVEIITIRMILHRKYSINVDAVTDAGTSVSVKEGDPVTLQIDVTEIQNNDLAVWMCGKIKLAEINKTEELYNIYGGPDERFTDRLKLDPQTGSLTITNTRTTHSGDYDLKISRSRFTINRRITVTVTGLSTGEIVGIVAGVVVCLLVVAGLLVAARAGRVIPCRRLHLYLPTPHPPQHQHDTISNNQL